MPTLKVRSDSDGMRGVGWPGSQLPEDCPIPDPEPGDNSPTAGLLSDQVVPVQLTDEVRSETETSA